MHEKKNLGFVLKCCGRKAEYCSIYPMSSNGDHLAMQHKTIGLRITFAFSTVLQISFVCLGTIMMLQKLLPEVPRELQHTLSKAFSTFWAITTAASMFWAVLFAVDMYSFAITVYYHPQMSGAALSIDIFSIILHDQIPIALYFGRKFGVTAPCIYLAPARLACCGNIRLAAWLVRTLFLLMSLSAVQIMCIHATYFILALGATPFIITTNIVLAIFVSSAWYTSLLFSLHCQVSGHNWECAIKRRVRQSFKEFHLSSCSLPCSSSHWWWHPLGTSSTLAQIREVYCLL